MDGSRKRLKVKDSLLMKYGTGALSRTNLWKVEEAVNAIKAYSFAGFDESVDITVKLNRGKKKLDATIRGVVELPHGNGKKKKILAICKSGDEQRCLDAGAAYAGGDEYIEKISQGFLDFNTVVADTAMLLKITKVSRILGTKKMMPNLKSGTVSPNIVEAIGKILRGQVEYKSEDTGIIQASVGRVSFDVAKIVDNVITFLSTLSKKGDSNSNTLSIKSVNLSSTMGFSFNIKISDILNRI